MDVWEGESLNPIPRRDPPIPSHPAQPPPPNELPNSTFP
jgi:hypothetical protein